MAGDWVEELSRKERAIWDRFVRHARTDAVRLIHGSAFVMTFVPDDGKPDVKFAVELGFGIMLNKPIITIAMKGQRVPPGLRRVSHSVIELTEDLDTQAGQDEMEAKLRAVIFALGLE